MSGFAIAVLALAAAIAIFALKSRHASHRRREAMLRRKSGPI
jgi:hypothetical protein